MQDTPVSRSGDRAGETPAGAGEDRAGPHLAPHGNAQRAFEVTGRNADPARAQKTRRGPEADARGDDVTRVDTLTDVGALDDADR